MPHLSSSNAPARKSLVVRIDEDIYDAFAAWALDEERSLAGQARVALRIAIPEKYQTTVQ